MARVTPLNLLRFRQALPGLLEVTFAGSEANVAASLAILGQEVVYVSAVPNHVIADACIDRMRGLGIDTRYIVRGDYGRLGLYFLETGANQRPSQVIYDRDGSTFALTAAGRYSWTSIFQNACWFHVTGITPAVSQHGADAAMAAAAMAKQIGATISCDLNFRKKLWRWKPGVKPNELAQETMRKLLATVDVVIANEEDCGDVLGIRAGATRVEAGSLEIDKYPDVARQVVRQFPNVGLVAITLRQSISASHNNWGAMLYEAKGDQAYFAPLADGQYRPYEIRNIVDRVGTGDSFAAALIYALTTGSYANRQETLAFATAASCLAHSISGDLNYVSRPEIESLMRGSGAGRVVR